MNGSNLLKHRYFVIVKTETDQMEPPDDLVKVEIEIDPKKTLKITMRRMKWKVLKLQRKILVSKSKKLFLNVSRSELTKLELNFPVVSAILRHTNQRSLMCTMFSCDTCSYRATTPELVKKHMKLKQKHMKYSCDHCNHFLTSTPDLSRKHKALNHDFFVSCVTRCWVRKTLKKGVLFMYTAF